MPELRTLILPPRGTGPRCRGRTTLGHSQETSDLGEFKRPQDLLSASVDVPDWLQHEGAADFECVASGCVW